MGIHISGFVVVLPNYKPPCPSRVQIRLKIGWINPSSIVGSKNTPDSVLVDRGAVELTGEVSSVASGTSRSGVVEFLIGHSISRFGEYDQ